MIADQVISVVKRGKLTEAQLMAILNYEQGHKGRVTVQTAVEEALDKLGAGRAKDL